MGKREIYTGGDRGDAGNFSLSKIHVTRFRLDAVTDTIHIHIYRYIIKRDLQAIPATRMSPSATTNFSRVATVFDKFDIIRKLKD